MKYDGASPGGDGESETGRTGRNLRPGRMEKDETAEGLRCPMKKRRCGGCSQLEVPYREQLRRKQRAVEGLLGRFCRPEPILGMETPLHYRNKAIATFSAAPRGALTCGIYEAHTHRVVPVRDCLLQDGRINEIIAAALRAAVRCRLAAYVEDRGTGVLRHMVVRRGAATGEVSVAVVTASDFFPAGRDFTRLLLRSCPDVVTVVQNVNPRHTSAVLGTRERVLFGQGYLTDRLCGNTFCVSTRAFYQVNPAQTERLYGTALEFAALTGKERVIDAYCGIGTIALTAAPRAAAVLGVELNGDAVRDARRNARINRHKNAEFVRGDAGEFMAGLAAEGETADLVFLDPPREGADRRFLASLSRLRPGRIVYISCEPSTLARDLSFLCAKGYAVRRARPVDMFPYTGHVECMVLMSRVKE